MDENHCVMLPFIQSSYLATLLECLGTGVVVMNIRRDVYACNDAAGRLLGLEREVLLQAHFDSLSLTGFGDPASVDRFLASAAEHDEHPETVQTIYSHPRLGLRHYTLSASRLVEYGKVFGIVLQIADVTNIYEMHKREKDMLEEQSRLQMERIEGLGRLSMSIAHQIRNPLMTIAGFARILERKSQPDDPGREFLQGIIDGASRLEAVVKAVTQYTAPVFPRCEATPMRPLLAKCVERLGALPEGLTVHITGTGGNWMLDPRLTSDALFELLQNALEACSPNGGTIVLDAREEARDYVIEVLDNGPGIPEESKPFLCDPFFTTKAVGVGMGLAKARRMVREMGGDLEFSVTASAETAVTVRLPKACGLNSAAK